MPHHFIPSGQRRKTMYHLIAIVGILFIMIAIMMLKVYIIWQTRGVLKKWGFLPPSNRPVVVGFFHPYCNAGGGGERVLWHSIHALQKRYSFVRCVVYTGDEEQPRDILNKAQERFGIVLLQEVKFVHLKRRSWVEAKRWPRFTLLGQSIGSMFLGLEALTSLSPHVYLDTMGCAFTLPLFRWLGGSKVASYVHYPVVSRDMLEQVSGGVIAFNNATWISRSPTFTYIKTWYYKLFAILYGLVGRRNDVVMVNSTWTHGHILELWKPQKLFIVYPPCDTESFRKLPLERPRKNVRVVSVGQFRPEKNHRMQLRVLAQLLHDLPSEMRGRVSLVLVGSCRNFEDHDRIDGLKNYAVQLGVLDHVEFRTNISFEELQQELGSAVAAVHTMQNEHFGISLVECMAAGCVMVAHASGGPLMDIVTNWQDHRTGLLAENESEFASCLQEVVQMGQNECQALARVARDSVQAKFSVEVFEASFLRATEQLFG